MSRLRHPARIAPAIRDPRQPGLPRRPTNPRCPSMRCFQTPGRQRRQQGFCAACCSSATIVALAVYASKPTRTGGAAAPQYGARRSCKCPFGVSGDAPNWHGACLTYHRESKPLRPNGRLGRAASGAFENAPHSQLATTTCRSLPGLVASYWVPGPRAFDLSRALAPRSGYAEGQKPGRANCLPV